MPGSKRRKSSAAAKRKIIWPWVSAGALFVNGLIFIIYAALVPTYVRGIHWLISLAAALFIVAIPGIHHSLRKMQGAGERILAILFALGMVMIIVSDALFALSMLSGLTHDEIYATGNALLLLYVLAVAIACWKGAFRKWIGYLSLLTVIVGFSTYAPGAPMLLSTVSLLLIGAWSISLGFFLVRPKMKHLIRR